MPIQRVNAFFRHLVLCDSEWIDCSVLLGRFGISFEIVGNSRAFNDYAAQSG